MLLRACAGVPGKLRIVIVGEGSERAAIENAAALLGLGDRVHLPGFLPEPHRFVALFDIFALSSRSEQFTVRSEEHTPYPQSIMRICYSVSFLQKKYNHIL